MKNFTKYNPKEPWTRQPIEKRHRTVMSMIFAMRGRHHKQKASNGASGRPEGGKGLKGFVRFIKHVHRRNSFA